MEKRKTYTTAGMLGAAAAFFIYATLSASPERLVQTSKTMLADAGVGMSASVPPNPYNTIAQQLNAKETSLNQREAQLSSREATRLSNSDRYGFYSLCVSIVLCLLVALNFYFDVRRSRRGAYSIDLR